MSLFPSLHAGEAAHASYDGETFLVSDQSRVHLLFHSCLMVQDLATQQLLEKNIPFLLVPSFVSLPRYSQTAKGRSRWRIQEKASDGARDIPSVPFHPSARGQKDKARPDVHTLP
ncbi:hypothetical protein RHMOL_Rhmol09G0074000 [Rhododendron molle]|uniref:Uncharacterized protein n=1 Tax=Rhododendron molle TaxID=49168 RepID=A0ACC0MBY9_RHOML|nr:hypothetical protein RHMOL_Rhmol09G0074000 [Rhododendron molle]